jgi:hypothetical protein
MTGCDTGVTGKFGILEGRTEFILPLGMFEGKVTIGESDCKLAVGVWFKIAESKASSASDRAGQENSRHKSGSKVSIATHRQCMKEMGKVHLPGNPTLSQANLPSPKGVAVSS